MPGFDRLASLFPGEGAVADFVKEVVAKITSMPAMVRSFATAIVGDEGALQPLVDGANAAAVLASVSNAVAVDLSGKSNFTLTLAENSTLSAPTGARAFQSGVIEITQGSGGSLTLDYDAFWVFAGGNTPPALSTTEGAVDVLSYTVNSDGTRAAVQLWKEEA